MSIKKSPKSLLTKPLGLFYFYDPYGIRTRVTAVKGRCLNRLTNGPMAEKEGFEPSRRLRDLHP